jgi:hypothetical protein
MSIVSDSFCLSLSLSLSLPINFFAVICTPLDIDDDHFSPPPAEADYNVEEEEIKQEDELCDCHDEPPHRCPLSDYYIPHTPDYSPTTPSPTRAYSPPITPSTPSDLDPSPLPPDHFDMIDDALLLSSASNQLNQTPPRPIVRPIPQRPLRLTQTQTHLEDENEEEEEEAPPQNLIDRFDEVATPIDRTVRRSTAPRASFVNACHRISSIARNH